MILSGIDAASRGYPTPMLDANFFFDLSGCDALSEVLQLCDPSGERNLVDHHDAFMNICSALSRIKHCASEARPAGGPGELGLAISPSRQSLS